MKLSRILLVALVVSLAACGSEITGPDTSIAPSQPSLNSGVTIGSGT
jgi:predicted small lipoprotein YifL